jgi:hypothetical protein
VSIPEVRLWHFVPVLLPCGVSTPDDFVAGRQRLPLLPSVWELQRERMVLVQAVGALRRVGLLLALELEAQRQEE